MPGDRIHRRAVAVLRPQGEVAAWWMSYADGRAISGHLNFFWITWKATDRAVGDRPRDGGCPGRCAGGRQGGGGCEWDRHAIWLHAAEQLLAPRKGVAEWAASLLEQHPESSIRYTLSALAHP